MRIAFALVGMLVGLIGIILVIGYSLPIQHKVSRSIRLKVLPDRIWNVISDFKNSPAWRHDLKSVEQVEYKPGMLAWREASVNGDVLTYATLKAIPEQLLIRKIVDEGLPFGGSWTFELASETDDVMLTVTENGEVYNPIFRFASRFIFGHYKSIDKYLVQLSAYSDTSLKSIPLSPKK